jgi:hypothetical protein
MIDAGPETIKGIQKLSERVHFKNGSLYFDGDLLDNAISKHIARMIQQGDDAYHSFVRFLENLALNPSGRARRELFAWVNQANLTITADGRFLAYKGVQNVADNLSVTRGVETVWVNGVEHVGYIPNPIGAIVEMARSEVDDNKNTACSRGLHAGTHSYANGFGSKLLLVAINPRDVVSVPKDASFRKLRICRYEVLELGSSQIEDTTYQGSHRWDGEPLATSDSEDDEDTIPLLCPECGDIEVSEGEICDNCEWTLNGCNCDCYDEDECIC